MPANPELSWALKDDLTAPICVSACMGKFFGRWIYVSIFFYHKQRKIVAPHPDLI